MNTFHTMFNPPPKPASPHGGVSLTDQSALAETDINTIVKRYNAGDRSQVHERAMFGDVSEVGDFAHALEVVRKAQSDFAALPSEVRDRFGNNPALLIDFLKDAANDEEAVKLGLKVVRIPEKSLEERIVDGVTSAMKEANPAPQG